MNPNILLRIARLLRHPPGSRQAKVMLVALVLSLGVVAIQHFIGWPSWAHVNRLR